MPDASPSSGCLSALAARVCHLRAFLSDPLASNDFVELAFCPTTLPTFLLPESCVSVGQSIYTMTGSRQLVPGGGGLHERLCGLG